MPSEREAHGGQRGEIAVAVAQREVDVDEAARLGLGRDGLERRVVQTERARVKCRNSSTWVFVGSPSPSSSKRFSPITTRTSSSGQAARILASSGLNSRVNRYIWLASGADVVQP